MDRLEEEALSDRASAPERNQQSYVLRAICRGEKQRHQKTPDTFGWMLFVP